MWIGYRIDPSKNMYRWYRVDIAQDLWDAWAVWTAWGRLGTRGRLRVLPACSLIEARSVADRIIAAKVSRGYRCSSGDHDAYPHFEAQRPDRAQSAHLAGHDWRDC